MSKSAYVSWYLRTHVPTCLAYSCAHVLLLQIIKISFQRHFLEREIENFFILNIQDYSPLKSIDDHEEFISINELDRIIKSLDINNNLIKHLRPALSSLLHFLFNSCINFGIHMANWKIANIIMLYKAGKPEDLVGSYRPLSLTSCISKLLEKAVADNTSN